MDDDSGFRAGAKAEGLSEMPEAKLEDAIAFLRRFRPDGPWTLTGIIPDGPTDTKTFGPDTADDALAWLGDRSGRMNLYYMVNPAMRPLSKKATKEDVLEAVAVWVDVDPKKGEDPAAARADAIARLMAYRVPPSFVIDSGGGVQAGWLLDEPFPIDGKVPIAEDFELYNLHLEIEFGGDSCHNVYRILRLPGTINLPNAKKRAAGRASRLATLIDECSSWERHPLGEFWAAQRKDAAPAAGQAEVQLDALPPRLRDLDELPAAVTPRTRMLIVQGDDPDDQQRYKSRSEVTFAVVCELVRANCTDEQIAAVITDPDFAISAHTRAQKPLLAYVVRQIARARAEADDPMLRDLNAKHFAVGSIGGKFRVASPRRSEIDKGREYLEYQTVADFKNRYMNQRVQTGTDKDGTPKYTPAGDWWLKNPMRRQYETIVFAPGETTDELNEFNLWRGLAITPEPHPWPLLHRLIHESLAAGNAEYADYILRWLAFAVQHPERPAEVALVFRGSRGVGKSTLGHVMRRMFGQHGMSVTHPQHLHGQFNDHLLDCVLLFADEAVAPGEKKAEQMIKVMITDPTLLIEPKGLGKFTARNRLHVMMASNERWVVPAGADERRFAIFDVSPHLAARPGKPNEEANRAFWDAL